jgi:hypothetical protein
MRHLAAGVIAIAVALSAGADEVTVYVSFAADANRCMEHVSLVATGGGDSLRVPVRGDGLHRLALPAGDTWEIRADAAGCWAAPLTWSSAVAKSELRLHVERAAVVTGTLAGEKTPDAIAARVFSLTAAPRSRVLLDGSLTTCELDFPRWQCSVPASRAFDLRLDAPGFASIYHWALKLTPDERRSLGITKLQEGASIAGWIEDPNGDPAKDAQLTLMPLEAAPPAARRLQTRVNDRGFFQFSGLSPGAYRLISEASGTSPAGVESVRVERGEAVVWPIAIAHVPSSALTIWVTPAADPKGKPWTLELVERAPLELGQPESVRRPTASDGRVAINSLHASEYDIAISDSDGSVVESVEVDLAGGGSHTRSIDIRTITVQGTLLLGEEPLEAQLTFSNDAGRSIRATSAKDGHFDMKLPARGTWDVAIRYPIHARASIIELDPITIEDAAAHLTLHVPGGRIRGEVVNATGEGEQAAVHVVVNGRPAAQLITDADGSFDIIGIRSGTYMVDAEGASGMTPTAMQVAVRDRETKTLRLVLDEYRWLRGTVRTPYGEAASGAVVRISTDDGRRWTKTTTDATGRFEYRLPSGVRDVQLLVLTYSHPAAMVRVDATQRAPVTIDLNRAGGLLRVRNGTVPQLRANHVRAPLHIFHFPEPFGRYGGGVYLERGSYLVCPDVVADDRCRTVTIAPSSEMTIDFTPGEESAP